MSKDLLHLDARLLLGPAIETSHMIYFIPNAGVCGVDFDVESDETVQAWSVDLHHGRHHLRTFIETDEASSCLDGKSCIPLGMQVAQLKRNFKLRRTNSSSL